MLGQGTKMYYSEDGGSTWNDLGDVIDSTYPEFTKEAKERSYLSDQQQVKRYRPGLIEPGEIEMTLVWDPKNTTQQALVAQFQTELNYDYRFEFPDGTTDDFNGFITKIGRPLQKDDDIQFTVGIKASGLATQTVAP